MSALVRLGLLVVAAALLTALVTPPHVASEAAAGVPADQPTKMPSPRPFKLHPKFDGPLGERLRGRVRQGLLGLIPDALALRSAGAEQVQAVAETAPGRGEAARTAILAAGGVIERSAGPRFQFRATPAALDTLAASADIRLLRRPYPAAPLAVTGQGVAASGASEWHAAGYTGRGVRIGVLDAGFARYSELLGTELPASVTVQSLRADGDLTAGGEIHGTAVAEIVHEMAPDAELVLVNYGNDVEFPAALAYLQSQRVDIITNSTGSFLWGPGDGTGPVNEAVTAAAQGSVFFSQAAGNHAQRHWSGAYGDTDADSWHNFAAGLNNNAFSQSVQAGTALLAELKWDDPYDNACNDYDLYLLDASLRIVAGSTGWQDCIRNPGHHPIEALSYVAPASGVYRLAVARYDYAGNPSPRPNARLDLYSHTLDLAQRTPAGSLVIPADNAAAATAGAYNWATPGAVESFSSQGPTLDGQTKPDLVGPDRVNTSPLTYGVFAGTSAAAPHLGAAAALVKQAHPGLTPAQIKAFLKDRAINFLGGETNVAGAGRLSLGAPPAAASAAQSNVAAPVAAPADAVPAAITVTVRDADGAAIAGKPVTLTSSRGALDVITPATALSDIAGAAVFTVTPGGPGAAAFTARAVAEGLTLGSATVAFVAGPQQVTVTPQRGPAQRTVQITGSGFAAGAGGIALRWGDAATPLNPAPLTAGPAGTFTFNAALPPSPPGAVTVRAVQGLLTGSASFTVVEPTILLTTPRAGPGAAVAITGADFYPLLPVSLSFDGAAAGSAAADAAGALSGTITVPAGAAAGDHTIAATQTGAATLTATATLTVVIPPRLDAVQPATAGQGAAGRAVVLTGAGFAPGMTASVGGAAITVSGLAVQGAQAATLTLEVSPAAATGPRDLTLTNPDGGSATFPAALGVTPAPMILSISPAEVIPGAVAADLLLAGSGFQTGAQVTVSGAGVTLTGVAVTGSGVITGQVQAAAGAAPGLRYVTVANPDGGTGAAALRLLGTLTETSATAGGSGAVTLNTRLASALPASGRLRATFPAGVALTQASLSGVTAGAASCAGSTLATAGQTVTVSLAPACAPAAGATLSVSLTGVTLTAPPSSVTVTLRTESADGAGVDQGAATLWQPTLALNRSRAAPGETVQAAGAGFPPGAAAVLALEGGGAAATETLATFGGTPHSDALGEFFAAAALPPAVISGPHRLTASAGGAQASAVVLVLPSPALLLSPPAGGAGSTVRTAGTGFAPDEAVTVRWEGDPAALATLYAGPAGAVTGDVLISAGTPPGARTLLAQGAGGRTATAPFTVTVGRLTLRGRVTERGSGDGVAGARGWANQPATGGTPPFATAWTSIPDGSFAVETPPGAYNIGAFVEGRALLTPEQGVTLLPDGSQTPAAITLEVAAGEIRLNGRVTQGTGAQESGVGSALVMAVEMNAAGAPAGLAARAHTDASGAFAFALPAGRRWRLSAAPDGLPPAAPTAVNGGQTVNADLAGLALRVPATIAISGAVDQGGAAAVAAPIAAAGPSAATSAADADGSYRLALPLPAAGTASYVVTAGSADTGMAQATVTVSAGGAVTCQPATPGSSCPAAGAGPAFHLPTSGIRLLAAGPGGDPLDPPLQLRAQARSSAGAAPVRAAGTSRGLLLPLADGLYNVEIAIPGVLTATRTAVTSPGAVTVEAPPTVTLAGTVTNGAAGAGGAAVVVQSLTDRRLALDVTSCTPEITPGCAAGSFAVRVPAGARYRLTAAKAGYLAAAPVEVTMDTAAPPAVTLALTPLEGGAVAQGRTSGAPPGLPATVTATLADGRTVSAAAGQSLANCAAPPDGYCLALPPGEWRLSARADGYATPEPGAALSVPASGPALAGPLLALAATGQAAAGAAMSTLSDAVAGGTVSDPGAGATVEAPPGAILDTAGPVTVTTRLTGDAPGAGSLALLDGLALQVDLRDAQGRRLTSFARPLAITLDYGPLLDAGRLTTAAAPGLQCARYDTAAGLWTPLAGVNDAAARKLTCFTDRLTKIAALTDPPAPVPSPTPTATVPPPASGGGGGGGGGGGSVAAPTPTPTPATPTPVPSRAEAAFPADHGSALSVQNVAVELPAGAASGAGRITASLELADLSPGAGFRLTADHLPGWRTPDGTALGATAFRLDVADEQGTPLPAFAHPARISVAYRDEDLRRAATEPQRLQLARYDAATAAWAPLTTAVDPAAGRLTAEAAAPGWFALIASVPAPALSSPAAGAVSVDMALSLRWTPPPGTLQHQVQVIPAANDGPGINLIIGDPEQVAAGRLDVPPPRMGAGSYILLPGMSYVWRVRVSPAPWELGGGDAGWSGWSERRFRTGAASSAGIAPLAPAANGTVDGLTPALRWRNSNERIFYYEVQVSRDPAFQTGPALATAAVYWNLVHGGVTDPLMSWTVPADAPLERDALYFWRVRPRVQGDGAAVEWSASWAFRTRP